jgi:hypothetical protein
LDLQKKSFCLFPIIMAELTDKHNVYAYNIKQEVIHVSEAESGRKGYFCMGCEKELQAVKSTKVNRISYFRHDPKNVGSNRTCIFSDETYRHKLAKEILERIKRVKVPALYKYPPKEITGLAYLLEEAKFIEARHVRTERYFYEDEDGEIIWGDKKNIDNKFLLIKPDVTFFDEKNLPILNIEIVATHKLTLDKLIKIKRLGIDTIQILIPKESPDEIEKTFSRTDRTKWIFNQKEDYAKYLPIPEPDSKGIPSIDELQRKFFEESFECRAAQINNLIRSIERCLESKPYRDIESANRSELSRVTRNTEQHRQRLQEVQDRHRRIIEEKYRNIGERYNRKREELEEEEGLLETHITEEERIDKEGTNYFERRRREINKEETNIDTNIERERGSIRNIQEDTRRLSEKWGKIIRSIKERNDKPDTEFPTEFKDFNVARTLLNDIKEAYSNRGRYRKAWECFRSGAYQNWND